MKFSDLAVDYDGTIAQEGVLDPEVRAAIAEVRGQGITVIIASGRTLSDLQRVAGDLGFVDAVVAENGAVLFLPNGHSRLLGPPPPEFFLAELKRRRIAFSTGHCIVEADASSAQPILAVAGVKLRALIESLAINEAAILPGPVTGGKLQPFKLLPRRTPHVRHRVKYFDVSAGEGRGFVFTGCHVSSFGYPGGSVQPESDVQTGSVFFGAGLRRAGRGLDLVPPARRPF